MKIRKAEVKTFYELEMYPKDFIEIVRDFKECEHDFYITGEEHDAMKKLVDRENKELASDLMQMQFRRDGSKVMNYITKWLKYDGIQNYGYYNDNRKVYVFVVYNYGDSMHKLEV